MKFTVNFLSKKNILFFILLSTINIYAESIPNWIINPKSIYEKINICLQLGKV